MILGISIPVLIWMLLTLLGLALSTSASYQAYKDRKAVAVLELYLARPAERLIADHAIAHALLKVLTYVTFGAMLVAPAFIVLELILANVFLILATLSDLYVGAMLRRMFRRNHPLEPEDLT